MVQTLSRPLLLRMHISLIQLSPRIHILDMLHSFKMQSSTMQPLHRKLISKMPYLPKMQYSNTQYLNMRFLPVLPSIKTQSLIKQYSMNVQIFTKQLLLKMRTSSGQFSTKRQISSRQTSKHISRHLLAEVVEPFSLLRLTHRIISSQSAKVASLLILEQLGSSVSRSKSLSEQCSSTGMMRHRATLLVSLQSL